jgi:hypothetical protein
MSRKSAPALHPDRTRTPSPLYPHGVCI